MPGKRYRHSVAVQNQDFGTDGIFSYRLGINPLSVLLLCLRPANSTGTLANYASYMGIAQSIERFTLSVRGEAIISARGEDLAALAYFRHGVLYPQANTGNTNADRRDVVIPIFLGRHAFDEECCLPGMTEGDLTMEVQVDDADTGYSDLQMRVETIELLDAKPKYFERKLAKNFTLQSGESDVQLQLGNVNRGCLLWGTTGVSGASPAPTWGRVRVRVDGSEQLVQSSDFETLHGSSSLWGRMPPSFDGHQHGTTVDGNAGTSVPTVGTPFNVGLGYQNYAYLDFDPTRDDDFSIDCTNARRFEVGSYSAVAEAVRVIQVERVDQKKLMSDK